MDTVRTFIAVEPDPPVRSWLSRWIAALRSRWPRIRWVSAEQLHITLKFLGDVPASEIEEVERIASEVARTVPPFRLEVGPPGQFGTRRLPQTFWLGFLPGDGLDLLMEVQGRLEGSLAKAGFPAEDRSFTPHLTIGRNPRKVPAEGWDEAVEPWPGGGAPGFLCRSLSVFSSRLTPQGPIHELLSESPFAGEAPVPGGGEGGT